MGLGAANGPARKYSPVDDYERTIRMPHFGQ
jgi:hypothetical protein